MVAIVGGIEVDVLLLHRASEALNKGIVGGSAALIAAASVQ